MVESNRRPRPTTPGGRIAQDLLAPKIRIQGLSYWYSGKPSLEGITMEIPDKAVTVLFGPAGGGKTTLMRLVNRLNDMVEDTHMTGRVLLDGEDIYAPGVDVAAAAPQGRDGLCPPPAPARHHQG